MTAPTGVLLISIDEALAIAERNDNDVAGCRVLFERWLGRGDTVCIYENQDFGHPDMGDKRFASYGSPVALLERTQFPDGPPRKLPDTPGLINWRYQLSAIVEPKR